jgi:integrase
MENGLTKGKSVARCTACEVGVCGVQQYATCMLEFFAIDLALAANDAKVPRSRTVPIPHSITEVPGYPSKLAVFKISASRFWQVRCWVAGRTHRQSTKTTSLHKAQSVARQFYENSLIQHRSQVFESTQESAQGKEKQVSCKPANTFGALAAQMYANEQSRVERGEFSLGSLQVLRNRLDAHILPRFAALPVSHVDYSVLLGFAQFLSQSFSTVTVSQYLIAVRKVLTHAARTKAIAAVPEFPKIKVVTVPRSAFTPTEYWKILRAARRLRGCTHPDSQQALRQSHKLRHGHNKMPPDMAWIVCFMVNAFIRPSDLRTLQHRHVEVVSNGNGRYLRLTLPETKKHSSPIVTLQPAVRVYQEICKHQGARPDDYLFFPKIQDRTYALALMSVLFNWVLAETKLKQNAHGKPRTLYSLRHSAITFRLLYGQGIDLLTLARNARTSVDVINTHYASTVTGEQNIALLQSRRQVQQR